MAFKLRYPDLIYPIIHLFLQSNVGLQAILARQATSVLLPRKNGLVVYPRTVVASMIISEYVECRQDGSSGDALTGLCAGGNHAYPVLHFMWRAI